MTPFSLDSAACDGTADYPLSNYSKRDPSVSLSQPWTSMTAPKTAMADSSREDDMTGEEEENKPLSDDEFTNSIPLLVAMKLGHH